MNLDFPAATSNNPDPPSSPPADLPTCNGSSSPSVPDPLSSHPIAPSSPPTVPTSAPANEPPSLDQALHVVARHIEAVGDNVVEHFILLLPISVLRFVKKRDAPCLTS